MTTISLTMDQLCALILAAQDGVLPQQRTARQERNRRYYEACKRRQAESTADETAPPASAATNTAVAPVSDSAPSAGDQTVSDTIQTHLDAVQTVSDAEPSEFSPSPSLPPSPPSPGPLSSAPTLAPPSAAAPAHVRAGRKPREPRQPRQKRAKAASKQAHAKTDVDSHSHSAGVQPESDETWLRHLEQCDAFRDIPLQEEYRRMVRWSTHRDMRITRTSFLEWLKRYERPLKLPDDIFAPPAAERGGFFSSTLADRLPHLFPSSSSPLVHASR